jgi:hypothetical protein
MLTNMSDACLFFKPSQSSRLTQVQWRDRSFSRLETYVQLPICSRWAIHFKLIVVSWRSPARHGHFPLIPFAPPLQVPFLPAQTLQLLRRDALRLLFARQKDGRKACGECLLPSDKEIHHACAVEPAAR